MSFNDELQSKFVELERRAAEDLAWLREYNLERKFCEHYARYVRRPYRRVRLISSEDLADLVDEAVDQGRITETEADEAVQADAVVRACDPDGELLLAVEVSRVIDRGDVERAARIADVLRRLGWRAKPAVAGVKITQEAEEALASAGVAWLKMGDDEPA